MHARHLACPMHPDAIDPDGINPIAEKGSLQYITGVIRAHYISCKTSWMRGEVAVIVLESNWGAL